MGEFGNDNIYDYKVEIIKLCDDDGGGFLATVPKLPGCMSDGETRKEALENIEDAIKCWIETAQELGRDIPKPDEYKMEDDFSGKLTLRIPKILHKMLSEQAHIESCSINQLITTYISLGIGNEFKENLVKDEVYHSLDNPLVYAERLVSKKWEGKRELYKNFKLDFKGR
jgi:antitoxin HicB